MDLRDRVVVITGGGQGIGLAMAKTLHAAGARVAIASRNARNLQTVAMEINTGDHRIIPLRCDVTLRDEVEVMIGNVVEVWDRIDILVNNAGVSGMTPVDTGGDPGAAELSERRWHDILSTNLTGMYYCTREAVRHMPGEGRGRILNLSSVLGKFGVAGYAAYCTSKTGVIGFTRALALELAPKRITVNALCPGWVSTDMALRGLEETARSKGISVEKFRQEAEARVPLQRFIEPAEVARLALFLASDAGAGITGQAINLDGGAAMW
jgi:NAD(P)-dependent dehydrogenase (short-subunit alcohol dehydrogenase family)